MAVAALLAFCCMLDLGCSAKGPSTQASGARLEDQDVSFYRHADEQAVFRVSKTTYCLVTDPAQMAAFGGFAKVRVVPPGTDFKRGRKAVAGMNCPSP